MLHTKQIYTNSPLRNYSYVVYSDSSGEAVCIDPYSAEQILTFLQDNSLRLTKIVNTHEHHDHVAGNLELKSHTNALVFAHPGARDKVPGIDGVIIDREVIFQSENVTIECLETPGHTFCHHCFLLKKEKNIQSIFSGDTLFSAGVGNCYRGGDPKILYQTIKFKLIHLPDETSIFPGHDYIKNNIKFAREIEPNHEDLRDFEIFIRKKHSEKMPFITNITKEKEINPFFRVTKIYKNNPVFFSQMDPKLPKTEENLFLYLRSVRDTW